MSKSAYIRDIASLEQLRIAIARFCDESENQLLAIDLKLQSRINNLKSLELQFQRILERAQDDLRNANNSLYSCESSTYEDEDGDTVYPDCDYEREEVIECRKRLELAEHNYYSFKREIKNLEISIAEYQNPKIKYRTLIQFEKEAATSSLKQLINGAEDYLSISSPLGNGNLSGLGLTDAIAKIDPTMIVAASIGIAEIMLMSVFSFLVSSGKEINFSNINKNGLITTIFSEKGINHVCSELKIEKKASGNFGKIISVDIPPSLQNEKIGKDLINNMEITCRANDCKEISGWTSSTNIDFYKNLGYQTRNEIKEIGADVFKPLQSNYYSMQQKAKAAFENLNNADFIRSNNLGKQKINSFNIISPDEMLDEKFWGQHGESQSRYIDLIEKYGQCKHELQNGKTLDQIRKENMWIANAYDVFERSEPIRLLKSDNYYKIDANGRHRVAAAQLYYLQTGEPIFLTAEVFERGKG